jgi:calcineurin-like phosphoesterase family protein
MDWFTADTHLGHKGKSVEEGGSGGIIRMSKRPYASIEEHDEDLIRRWNERVGPKDTVWHLGDFALGDQKRIPGIVARLNGRINLCWGNHDDKKIIGRLGCFQSTQDVAWIKQDGHRVFLSHYAHRVWNRSHHGSFHLYGHSHGSIPPHGRSLDVGVDCWNYAPVSFAEIVERMKATGHYDLMTNHHPDDGVAVGV